jgi:hypothetical protein
VVAHSDGIDAERSLLEVFQGLAVGGVIHEELDLDPSMLLGVSASGCSNNEIALAHIQHFDN